MADAGDDHADHGAPCREGQTQRQTRQQRSDEADHRPHRHRHRRQQSTVTGSEQAINETEHHPSGGVLMAAELLGLPLQQQRREHRGEGEGVERGDPDGEQDRCGELLVDRSRGSGKEQHRQEHRHLHQRRGDDRTEQLVHRLHRGLNGGAALRLLRGGVLHHRDRVVHHQTRGQHQPEQGQLIQREPEGKHQCKGADQCHRNGDGRHQGGLPVLQKQEQDQHHQDHGIAQGIGDSLDRLANEIGGVIDLLHLQAHRQGLLKGLQHVLDAVGHLDRIASGELIDRHTHRGRSTQVDGINAVDLTTEGDTPHILEFHQATIGVPGEHDVFEFAHRGQTTLQLHREGEVLTLRRWITTHLAGGNQSVLALQLLDHVRGRQPAGGEFLRIQPEAESDLAVSEVRDIADAFHPLDVVRQVLVEISTDRFNAVVGVGIRCVDEVVNQQDRIGGLVHRHARLTHLLRKLRLC